MSCVENDTLLNDKRMQLIFKFSGIFQIKEDHLKISICPRHREAYGIRWRCQKKLCSVPPNWSVHKKKELKGDRGLTLPQSKLLYRLTSVLVPVGSRKSIFFQFVDVIFRLRPRMFLSIYCLNFVVSSDL